MLLRLALLPLLANAQPLPGTLPLEWTGDGADLVVSGIHRFLDQYQRPAAPPTRERLAYILGVNEPRINQGLETLAPPLLATRTATVSRVRWQVLDALEAEGLLIDPARPARQTIILLGDADQSPEHLAAAHGMALAAAGCRVLIPLLMDRQSTLSGLPGVRLTNMPHREFLWRQLYPLGRHIIGVEVQKTLAAIDALASAGPVHLAGYGEGGLIALHAAALDSRPTRVLVSGHFGPRDRLWTEPVYRDIWGLLPDFRDAALATLAGAQRLIIEAAPGPIVNGPPPETKDRRGAEPNTKLQPFPLSAVQSELARISGPKPRLIESTTPFSNTALAAVIGVNIPAAAPQTIANAHAATRMERQFRNIIDYARRVIRESPKARAAFYANADRSSVERWQATSQPHRQHLWRDLIGRLPNPTIPPSPRTRLLFDQPKFRGYEVVLDVWDGVPAYGYLLVPKDIAPGERRAAVVCQHGLEGRPKNVADPTFNDPTYSQFAVKLAEEGFVTFSPQNPYVLGDRFRQINRKAHPWALSMFAFIAGQHDQILNWLGSLNFIDPARIGCYGLSYGGYTAQRIPALLERYALSINSGNFNEWVWKVASLDAPFVYPLTGEYDIPEFNFAHLTNYYELSTLIFPRPFMVERGHKDGVSWDEWVAFEYAKVYRFYSQMGLAHRTAFEYFDGPHQIHGVGTFEFLKKHLKHPR